MLIVSTVGRRVAPVNGASGAGATIVFIGVRALGGNGGGAELEGSGNPKGLAIVSGGSSGKFATVGRTIGSVGAVGDRVLGSTFSI